MNNKQLALIAVLTSIGLAGFSSPTQASKNTKDQAKVETKKDTESSDLDSAKAVRFGNIPSNASNILIVAESARVIIKRTSSSSEIVLSSNCPRNWSLQGSLLRQAGFCCEVKKGSALLADALGSRAIVNGHVYLLPSGGMKGLKLSPEGVSIEGNQVEPLKGSDIPGNCSGEDLLVITVPDSYTGGLKIGCTGKSQVKLDSWKDGAIELSMFGESSFTAGKLESLPKAAFDNKSKGDAEISEVEAKVFVANIRGNGNIKVKSGKADMSNATVDGNGTIILNGKFENLKQAVSGNGKIEVNGK